MAKPQLPRSIHDLAIRTVDRIKDRAAVIGIAFFLLGILGSIKSDWCLLAALVFYGIWAVVRIGVLRLDVQAKTAVASNRLAAAIEDATGKIAAHRRALESARPTIPVGSVNDLTPLSDQSGVGTNG
jgi:hypothetical protein